MVGLKFTDTGDLKFKLPTRATRGEQRKHFDLGIMRRLSAHNRVSTQTSNGYLYPGHRIVIVWSLSERLRGTTLVSSKL